MRAWAFRTILVMSTAGLAAGAGGCSRTAAEPGASSRQAASAPAAAPIEPLAKTPAPARLVAIGDLHGDLQVTRAALRLAGAIDDKDRWAGGGLVVVQVGDQIDRGDQDKEIIELFDRLRAEAKAAGGMVMALVGNHEAINVSLRFDYVTPAGLRQFENLPGLRLDDPRLATLPAAAKPRGAAFMAGGPYAKKLAERDAVAIVGDTLFVHGGVEPKHVKYGLARINREISRWMAGESPAPSDKVLGEGGVLWSRRYSAAPEAKDCEVLRDALALSGARRMVVGHTVQRGGISPACDGRVWRIDVGLSHHYGGELQVLEIAGEQVKVLKAQ